MFLIGVVIVVGILFCVKFLSEIRSNVIGNVFIDKYKVRFFFKLKIILEIWRRYV